MYSRDRKQDRKRQGRAQLAAASEARLTLHEPTGRDEPVSQSTLASILARSGAGLLRGGTVHPAVESLIDRQRGAGRVVNERVRRQMEPLTGDSLRDVRVHDDSIADGLARSVQARAFATGRDLFFARGEYRPGTASGDWLLAHELTHAAQQRGAAPSGPLRVSEPGDRFERDAERTAREAGG
jgi:hypothetical protein